MHKIFVSILATASIALATPLTIASGARSTSATIVLCSSPAASSTSRGTVTTTSAAALVTRAPSANMKTLKSVTHPHMDPRGRGRYSLDPNTFISDYDGHIITVRPSIPATTLGYHGTHPLTLLTGNRCPDCDRVGDPYDQGDYNGRYSGDHRGFYDPGDDDLYVGNREYGFRFGPGSRGRHSS